MSQDLLYLILNYSIPCAFGAFLAVVGLVSKYPTEMKYVYRSLSTWIYILLSSSGSLLFTIIMEVIGTKAVGNALLNSIVLGIIGPAVFLGVVSRLPPPLSADNEVEHQIKTLRDYVYDILDKSISRKTTQVVELKIRDAGKSANSDWLLREVDSMLEAVPMLTDDQKRSLSVRFDETAVRGEYAPIIRELKKYYDVDYIIKRLSFEYEQKQMRSRLHNLMQVALETHGPHNSVPPEFIIAKVQALQKDSDGALYYLEQAFQKKPSLKKHILTNEADWWILTSMTHGEIQQAKIDILLSVIEIKQLALEDIKQQCLHQDKLPITFLALKRNDGNCVKITLRSIHKHQTLPSRWGIRSDGDKHLDNECNNIDEVISHIEKVVIPIRLV